MLTLEITTTLHRACAPSYSTQWPAYRRPMYLPDLGHTVFTDTSLLLALPGNPLGLHEHTAGPGALQIMQGLLARVTSHPPSVPLSLESLPAPTPCRAHGCTGGKVWRVPCPDCNGQGHFEHGLHRYTCQACFGNGTVDASPGAPCATQEHCRECNGLGEMERPHRPDPLAPALAFDARRLRIAAALPGARIDTAAAPGFCTVAADGGIWGALGRMT